MKIFLKALKWICIILGFFGLVGFAEISWRGLREEWKNFMVSVTGYNNPKPNYRRYNI